jgi:oxygen-independent coproporphyrinogen III oxidase
LNMDSHLRSDLKQRLGLYIHIPHCLQICTYCDFTKYELGTILSPKDYTNIIVQEILWRRPMVDAQVQSKYLASIAFGGGTPSLLSLSDFELIFKTLRESGFDWSDESEISLELNPGTIDRDKLKGLIDLGFRRFSVGAQSFDDKLLKIGGRKHSARDTHDTLALLKSFDIKVSVDLLFAMPRQDILGVREDLRQTLEYDPQHISPYFLTIPEKHILQMGRASEEVQADMFSVIETTLEAKNYVRYEISNYAKPGYESKHNLRYWRDQGYLGLGVSAHSYFPGTGEWGTRFWNAPSIKKYISQMQQVTSSSAQTQKMNSEAFFPEQFETLQKHQSLTDFCHTQLRLQKGMNLDELQKKFGLGVIALLKPYLDRLLTRNLLAPTPQGFQLSKQGRLLANLAFSELTFLAEDC